MQKQFCSRKQISISRFSFYNTFWNIQKRFRPKNRPKFLYLSFFTIFGHFGQKITKSEKNSRFWDFRFKIRFATIPTKKYFWSKFFDFVIFSILNKKMSKSKEIIKRKNFDIVIFVLKYILKNSKSIPTEKQFRKKLTLSF